MKKHILCRKRQTNLPHTDHTYHFRKWLGRDLTPHEYEVINTLERIRRRTTIKVHIIDKPGVNSREILIAYMRYLQTLYPRYTSAVIDKDKKTAKAVARSMPHETFASSVRRPNYLRGMNCDIVLLLNPRADNLGDHIATTMPVICHDLCGCALIVLTTPPENPITKGRKRYIQPVMVPFYYQQLIDKYYRPGPKLEYITIIDYNQVIEPGLTLGQLLLDSSLAPAPTAKLS